MNHYITKLTLDIPKRITKTLSEICINNIKGEQMENMIYFNEYIDVMIPHLFSKEHIKISIFGFVNNNTGEYSVDVRPYMLRSFEFDLFSNVKETELSIEVKP
jgi:hypothetical protein